MSVNYLQWLYQCVIIDCKCFEKCVLSGVPQGSILGPILFVLFINNLPQGIDSNTNLVLYDDDTKLWRKITCDSDLAILQNDTLIIFLTGLGTHSSKIKENAFPLGIPKNQKMIKTPLYNIKLK